MTETEEKNEIIKDKSIRRLKILCLRFESNRISDIDFYGSCVDIYRKLHEEYDIILELKDTDSIKHCMYIRTNNTEEINEDEELEKNVKMNEIVKIDRRESGLDSLLDI